MEMSVTQAQAAAAGLNDITAADTPPVTTATPPVASTNPPTTSMTATEPSNVDCSAGSSYEHDHGDGPVYVASPNCI